MGGENKNIEKIYKEVFPSIRYHILSNSGSEEDAEDIFQEALIILLSKIRTQTLKLSCSMKTYLYSICMNLWYKALRNRLKEIPVSEYPEHLFNSMDEESGFRERLFEIYYDNLLKLDSKKRQLLELYLDKTPMKEISEELGLSSEKYAKVKKYLTKEHLKNNILNDTRYKELVYQYSA